MVGLPVSRSVAVSPAGEWLRHYTLEDVMPSLRVRDSDSASPTSDAPEAHWHMALLGSHGGAAVAAATSH